MRDYELVLIINPDIPEEDVYCIIKAFFTDEKERNRIHPQAKNYSLKAVMELGPKLTKEGFPFHPGVTKYLKEIGAWKPEFDVK